MTWWWCGGGDCDLACDCTNQVQVQRLRGEIRTRYYFTSRSMMVYILPGMYYNVPFGIGLTWYPGGKGEQRRSNYKDGVLYDSYTWHEIRLLCVLDFCIGRVNHVIM